jgi:hypothetical protein
MWNKAYSTILRANKIIDADITGDNVPALKAQAYAGRALMYFKLVNAYARPYTDDPMGREFLSFYIMILMHSRHAIR